MITKTIIDSYRYGLGGTRFFVLFLKDIPNVTVNFQNKATHYLITDICRVRSAENAAIMDIPLKSCSGTHVDSIVTFVLNGRISNGVPDINEVVQQVRNVV